MPERKLFSPYTLGALTLPNRIAMAPMTRCRATNPAIAPTPMMVEYYGLRADAAETARTPQFDIEFADGRVTARPDTPPARPARKPKDSKGQPSLF